MLLRIWKLSDNIWMFCFYKYISCVSNLVPKPKTDPSFSDSSSQIGEVYVRYMIVCIKTCLAGLFIRSIFRGGKLHRRFSASAVFSSEKSNELTDQQDVFCFNHLSAFYTSNNVVKLLMNNKFKAQTLTGNPTGNYSCQLLASRALNMSCTFSQSVRSIETDVWLDA